jgi:outer membrane protein assembly factor BamB
MPAWELRSAFPASLALAVTRVAARLGAPGIIPSADAHHVVVGGEALAIPCRVYFDPECLAGSEALPAVERLVLMCIFTRHHDGHVREAALRAIVGHAEPWVAPFVVLLLGEYVIEIAEVIKSNLPSLAPDTYAGFVAANPEVMAVTRQRATSYWSCYYRHRFPNRSGFTSLEVLGHLEALATSLAPADRGAGAPPRRAVLRGGASGAPPSSSVIPGEIWRHDLHQRPTSRAVIAPDLLLVQERRSYLTRLDPASGASLWSARVQNPWGWIARDLEQVYYLNQHALVQCHALKSGEPRWTATMRGTNGWLVAAGPVVLVGGWRGYSHLTALDAATGEIRWHLDAPRERLSEPMAGPWGFAVASLDTPVVRFLDPATGALRAEVPLPDHGQDAADTPLLRRAGDQLVLAGRGGRYHALAAPSGTWAVLFTHPAGIATIAPPVLGDAVVFMDGAGHLNCYGLVLGERRWSATWQHGRRDLLPAAQSPAGLLAVGSANGRLAVFDRSGCQLWSKVVAKRIETDLAWADDQTVVAGTTSALMAVRPPLAQAARS